LLFFGLTQLVWNQNLSQSRQTVLLSVDPGRFSSLHLSTPESHPDSLAECSHFPPETLLFSPVFLSSSPSFVTPSHQALHHFCCFLKSLQTAKVDHSIRQSFEFISFATSLCQLSLRSVLLTRMIRFVLHGLLFAPQIIVLDP
jgi:hypothetical protein